MSTTESKRRPARGFSGLSPLAKIAIWLGAVTVLAAAVQTVAWALGLDFNILLQGGGGRGVLLALALGSLLAIMAADGRPAADYGLAAGQHWQRRLFGGFLIGVVGLGSYYALVVLPWAGRLNTGSLTAGRATTVALASITALVVALTQQIIFGGYLLNILRQRHGKLVAVLVPAALFAVLRRLDDPRMLLDPQGYPLIVGLFLIATLLGILCIKTGSIMLSAGVLSGCIFVRRFLHKTALVSVTGSPDTVGWIAPNEDPVQAPLLWGFLAVAIALCWWLLRETRPSQAAASKKVDTGFKRVFPFSNASMLAPLDLWIARLADARFRVGPKYLPRLAAILVFSSVNTILTLPERLLAPLLLGWRKVRGPVFIVGVHRSGTTHLHNMLALDPQFCTPRTYQTLNPAGFLSLSWLVAPLLGAFLPWKRPMDSVRFHIFTPQEDEFALAGMSRLSPHWGMTFPRRGASYDGSMFPQRLAPGQQRAWQRHLTLFLRKLTCWTRRRPLLKNPYHTGRVEILHALFPDARFIHIHRNPYHVYRSNMHLAREGHIVYQLQDPDPNNCYETRFLDNYRAMEEAYYEAARGLPDESVAEVRFEDLEQDPLGVIRQVYARLGLEFSPAFEERLDRYLESIAGYQKNSFHVLPDDQQRQIDAKMGPFIERWGYADAGAQCEERKAA